jgi:hypothetical protein
MVFDFGFGFNCSVGSFILVIVLSFKFTAVENFVADINSIKVAIFDLLDFIGFKFFDFNDARRSFLSINRDFIIRRSFFIKINARVVKH